MKQTENEIKLLKNYHIEMWNLVQMQVEKAFASLRNFDKGLAKEIITREKMVNAQELVVDHHCEDFIALFAPVAVDLRFVISLLKITNNLERIGDFAESIALFVNVKATQPIPDELFKSLRLEEMMQLASEMLAKAREALIDENSLLCTNVLAMDDTIDEINAQAVSTLAQYAIAHPDLAEQMFHIHAIHIDKTGR